ncbi:MAG: hypothetical protein ACRDTT_17475 [Pseudonocardiaceae bacterium]
MEDTRCAGLVLLNLRHQLVQVIEIMADLADLVWKVRLHRHLREHSPAGRAPADGPERWCKPHAAPAGRRRLGVRGLPYLRQYPHRGLSSNLRLALESRIQSTVIELTAKSSDASTSFLRQRRGSACPTVTVDLGDTPIGVYRGIWGQR